MTNNDNSEIKNQLKITNIIFFALISGMIFFLMVVIVLIQNNQPQNVTSIDKIFTFIVPAFGLLIMFASRLIYSQMVSKISNGVSLIQKISFYRTAKIVQWAMIEAGCIFSLVATLITSNYFYLAVFLFLFGSFFLFKPSKESLIRELRMNSEESDIIQKS